MKMRIRCKSCNQVYKDGKIVAVIEDPEEEDLVYALHKIDAEKYREMYGFNPLLEET